ncbi:AAA family ATPase [Candidatus Viadribacter manganicus]|uniref:AAA domain-containing protein n=1 Tax=Candidatus Viadribacter manganicus TaxID=1759059 RepID=A0A1B1AIE3_9PROT|nr:AAA family ATPase [Candidatus Viadribacter manganicus]ANP46325.1 hypothetical protein ATE48_10555 [Candidatus Viadribacter manganicus]
MLTAAQKAKSRARQRTRPAKAEATLELTAGDVIAADAEEAPFEPPPLDDIFGCEEAEDDEAPFDPPEFEFEDETGRGFLAVPPPEPPPPVAVAPIATPEPEPQPQRDRLLPAISIFAAYDRPESQALLKELAADPRLARAEMQIARGGIEAALDHCADLYVLDTTLERGPMLAALDRLRAHAPTANVVILGAVNDIALLRDLAARHVSDYIVPPAGADRIARSLCALFEDVEPAHVIAVIGARGGIGASTLAQNLAWVIAERQQQRTTLVDLDLSLGTAAHNFRQSPSAAVRDVLVSADVEQTLTQSLTAVTPRLHLLAAPKHIDALDIPQDAFDELMANLRRTAHFVVLDLPHAWEPWVRTALRDADEIVIVAGPDLASLRNADNMLKLLRSERDRPSMPAVVLSMNELPKRPEIPLKDFAQALKSDPVMSFSFEPELFGAAEADGQTIFEAMPDSKAALQLDTLATMLTGHEPKAPPVLELVTPIQPQSRRQRVARSGFIALQAPLPEKRRSSGLIRAVGAVAALVAVGVWYAGQHTSPNPAPQEAGGAYRT